MLTLTWAAKRQGKARTKQTTSAVIACEPKARAWWQRGHEAPFWPYAPCHEVCALSLTESWDGCVTGSQAGCMSRSYIPQGGWNWGWGVNMMGWGGGRDRRPCQLWRAQFVPASSGHWFTVMVLPECFPLYWFPWHAAYNSAEQTEKGRLAG